MELLEQCQIWNENNEYQKIIDALEAVPAGERTPEMDSELARAYNNIAGPEERALYWKAIRLLEPHAEYFKDDHCWNFRMAYAYYYLDQEGMALRYFEKALEARPGDRDTQELIADCRQRLAMPRFAESFRERTAKAWDAFAREEAELRRMMDGDREGQNGREIIAKCEAILNLAFEQISFNLGFNGEKYELILTPEGDRLKLFELAYFQRRAPGAVTEKWNILVGRQPAAGCDLRSGGWEVSGGDVQVWAEKLDRGVGLTLYCEKLLPLLREEESRAWWMLSTLTDQVLGEIPGMRYIARFDVTDTPGDGKPIPLTELPGALEDMGLNLSLDPWDYLGSETVYQTEPDSDPDADWRMDVVEGSTCCPPLINGYLSGEDEGMDALHADGAAAGFLCYPLDGFDGEDRDSRREAFRAALESALTAQAGEDALTLTGSAAGLYCGYVDFIAWDLSAVLSAAVEFFQGTELPWASFHVFRRAVPTVRLLNREPQPQIHEETGSLLSQEEIETMESLVGEASGYYGRMFEYIRNFVEAGVQEGKFTRQQAQQDLQVALWYAYACLNMDEYEFYYRAAQWLPGSEKNAGGCGTWYYRYSVALMYCGRLEEARQYAEQGTREEPDYPWIWLQASKLRSHVGDRTGALEAVERGLALVPGDYEFQTLREEILSGATLEQMEYHWINPEADSRLQSGLDRNADSKQRVISCININQAGLASFMELFGLEESELVRDDPYCIFVRSVRDRSVEVVFRMNQAGLSKLDGGWLAVQKARLDDGRWLTLTIPDGEKGRLEAVLFDLDYSVTLVYEVEGEENRYFRARLNEDGTVEHIEKDENQSAGAPEYYSQDEMAAVEEHIRQYFGSFERVWHELASPDIHVDICLIPPGDERDYYTLVTMGMGAHRMNVPGELADHKLERAELAIALPPDWKLGEKDLADEQWYWPIRLLKVLARLPIQSDTWLGWGHTVDNQEAFAENTGLCAAMLISPQGVEEGAGVCALPDGSEVNFYQVIPLYREELRYKVAHEAEDLLEQLEGLSFVVDPDRPNAVEAEDADLEEAEPDETGEMDDGAWHIKRIREKHLPVEELNAFNHMAIYLRWCMEHDLMSLEFLERYGGLAQRFQEDLSELDLRPFIRDRLNGKLFFALFDDEGEAFARHYYGQGDTPCFPADIDSHALEYFGPARYHSAEFDDEAYLFVPFDEDYYQAMAKVIQARWDSWCCG